MPPSAGKENRLGAALLAAQAAQGLQAHPVRGGSGAHPPPAAGVLSPRLGLATPVAPRSGGGSGRLLTALSGVSVGMEMEGEEAGTPAYFTSVSGGFAAGAPFAASPAAPPAPAAYSLWGGGVGGAPLGLSAQQLDPFAAPASAFASAWEVAATPAPRAAAAPLSRAASASEDALRAASGFLPPPYSAFAQQVGGRVAVGEPVGWVEGCCCQALMSCVGLPLLIRAISPHLTPIDAVELLPARSLRPPAHSPHSGTAAGARAPAPSGHARSGAAGADASCGDHARLAAPVLSGPASRPPIIVCSPGPPLTDPCELRALT